MSGRRLTAAKQAARNRAIVAERAQGKKWSTLAREHKLSVRQCQNIWAQFREEEFPDETDFSAAIKDQILFVDSVIEDCQLLAESTKNDAVGLGALRTKMDAFRTRVELMRALGVLPARFENAADATLALRWLNAFDEALHRLQLKLPPDVFKNLVALTYEFFEGPQHAKAKKAREDQRRQNVIDAERRKINSENRARQVRAASGEDLIDRSG